MHELITRTSRRWFAVHSEACAAADRTDGPAAVVTHRDPGRCYLCRGPIPTNDVLYDLCITCTREGNTYGFD